MNKNEKLFKKLSKKNREQLFLIITILLQAKSFRNLDIVKIKNSDFYRFKKGKFRIIFHQEGKNIIIDSIKLRDEKTYKGIK